MLNALKTVYEMLKLACVRYDATQLAHDKSLKQYQADIATLRKENDLLIAEQGEAINMIAAMAKVLDKH